MGEMVERIAQAIYADLQRQDWDDQGPLPDDLTVDWLDQGRVDFGDVARAAVEALRRPDGEFSTTPIGRAIGQAMERGGCTNIRVDAIREVWDAVVDEALK